MISRDVLQLHITGIFWKMNYQCIYRMFPLWHKGECATSWQSTSTFQQREKRISDYEGRWRGLAWHSQSPNLNPLVMKIGWVSQTQLVNILLLRSFIHTEYLRRNYMFRPFFRPSSGWSYILFEATIQYAILSLWYLTRSCFHRQNQHGATCQISSIIKCGFYSGTYCKNPEHCIWQQR